MRPRHKAIRRSKQTLDGKATAYVAPANLPAAGHQSRRACAGADALVAQRQSEQSNHGEAIMTEIAHETVRVSIDDTYFDAYLAHPKGSKGGIVVIQEIFGVNADIKQAADWLAERAIWHWRPVV